MNRTQKHSVRPADSSGPRTDLPSIACGTGRARRIRMSRSSRLRGGRTLLEAIIAALLSLFVGTALLMLVQSTITARSTVLDENAAMRDTRRTLDTLENNLRNAQMNGGQAFSAASSNSVTCYTAMTGAATARYWLDTTVTPNAFKQTVGGVTTTLLTDVQSIQFTYYVGSSANFTGTSAQWSTTTNANAPTNAELPNIGAIGITASVTNGGVSRTLTTLVRLRNSPSKPHI